MWMGSSAKVQRVTARQARRVAEETNKTYVRRRDRRCRFPLCGCRKFGFALHVSHQQHKGMGGNPKGDRSTGDRMILVCAPRHREHPMAIDKGTVKWEGLTRNGSDGPVRWLVRLDGRRTWTEVARERAVQELEPLTEKQRRILRQLAEMTQ
jgi:hypothetical protein